MICELKDIYVSTTHSLVEALPSSVSEIRVERANADKDMLVAWLSYNNTQDWSLGLRLIQNQKNSAYHAGIKCRLTLYSAMFGCSPKVGLKSTTAVRNH